MPQQQQQPLDKVQNSTNHLVTHASGISTVMRTRFDSVAAASARRAARPFPQAHFLPRWGSGHSILRTAGSESSSSRPTTHRPSDSDGSEGDGELADAAASGTGGGSPMASVQEGPAETVEEAELMEAVYLRSVQCPGGMLDRQVCRLSFHRRSRSRRTFMLMRLSRVSSCHRIHSRPLVTHRLVCSAAVARGRL